MAFVAIGLGAVFAVMLLMTAIGLLLLGRPPKDWLEPRGDRHEG